MKTPPFSTNRQIWRKLDNLHAYYVANDDTLLNLYLEDMSDKYIHCIYKRLQTLKSFEYTGVDNSTERKIVSQ